MSLAARTLAAALIGLLPLGAGSAAARADDLDQLFDLLRSAPDMLSAQIVEQRIWQTWLRSGDAQADALMRLGVEAMDRGEMERAVDAFTRLIALRPDYAEGWNKRATAYYLMQELERSVADIERTLALEPRHFGALSGMGLIFLAREDLEGALGAFRQVLVIHPRSLSAHRHVEAIEAVLRGRAA